MFLIIFLCTPNIILDKLWRYFLNKKETDRLIVKSNDGLLYCLRFGCCDATILQYVLNINIPYIFVSSHWPNRYLEWWNASIPLSVGGKNYPVSVRNLGFDIQMKTKEFLEVLPEFKSSTISILQLNKPLPGSLVLNSENKSMNHILIQNGLFLKFYLPHEGEVALLCCTERNYLEELLQKKEIFDLVY